MTATAQDGREAPPLSVAQEALWYRSLLAPSRLTYNETISIRKDGPLDVPALRRAFDEIVRRHEAWRTTFEIVDGQPAQVVHPGPSFELPVIDLGHLTPEQAESQAVRLTAEVSRVPYDVRRGPLVRPRLFRFPADHHRLYLAMHHLVFDGVSVTRVVLPELVMLYEAFRIGSPSPLAEPSSRYADYARWEQRWIAEPRAVRRLERWREHLAPSPRLALALDHSRPDEPRLGGTAVPLSLPRQTLERLRAAGQSAGATLFQVLATGWSVLLGRYSGQPEVVFATAADLRQRPEFQLVVGCCLTPLVLRIDLSGDPSFSDLVVRVRNELLDGLDQLVPFERLVRELHPSGPSNENPVYQTMIVLEPATAAPDPAWSLHQIDSVLASAVGGVKLDLELQLDERPDGHLAGQLIFDRDLFETESVQRMVDHWLGLLEAVAQDPSRTISSIPTLTPAERQRQLVEWNATAVETPRDTVHALVARRSLGQPDAPAVSDGSSSLGYGQLNRRADSVAARLLAAGVRRGDVVALLSQPCVDLVVGALGVLKAGAAHLLLDPALPAAQLQLALSDAGAAAILAPGAVAGLDTPVGALALAEPDDDDDGDETVPEALADAGLDDRACYVQHAVHAQSAVPIGHASAVNFAAAMATGLEIGASDTILVLPWSLLRAPAMELWTGLIAGARLVLAPAEAATDGRLLSRLISSERVTFLHASPVTWQALIDTGLRAARGLRALSGGEPLSEALAGQILDRCRVLWNAYGTPQTTLYCTLGRVERSAPPMIGRPIANTRAYVVDRHGQPVPVGAAGELLVAGDSLDTGYLNRPEPAAEMLVGDPVGPATAYRTGDLARWLPDGRLQLMRRRDA